MRLMRVSMASKPKSSAPARQRIEQPGSKIKITSKTPVSEPLVALNNGLFYCTRQSQFSAGSLFIFGGAGKAGIRQEVLLI
ncbi:hypothetical protein Cflav_PD4014 [Pedosphaera parvula Ellin514]|uniref:Uncharacterized protein n=1 Tax=Pedosphaera parvula (strain Ellin514) TaxID=320771 RepID=B9XGS4_PEDPL|nr:hypothetical protein Cflav_PD4014 [Pedosphaera parvula Ellin514]